MLRVICMLCKWCDNDFSAATSWALRQERDVPSNWPELSPVLQTEAGDLLQSKWVLYTFYSKFSWICSPAWGLSFIPSDLVFIETNPLQCSTQMVVESRIPNRQSGNSVLTNRMEEAKAKDKLGIGFGLLTVRQHAVIAFHHGSQHIRTQSLGWLIGHLHTILQQQSWELFRWHWRQPESVVVVCVIWVHLLTDPFKFRKPTDRKMAIVLTAAPKIAELSSSQCEGTLLPNLSRRPCTWVSAAWFGLHSRSINPKPFKDLKRLYTSTISLTVVEKKTIYCYIHYITYFEWSALWHSIWHSLAVFYLA